jgi:outer membrane protein OmpA-like peptidoglycan-associated protein
MTRIQFRRLMPVLLAAFVLIASFSFAQVANTSGQSQSQAKTLQVPEGQRMNVEGVLLSQQPGSLTLRSSGGAVYNVTLAKTPEVKEKKSNPFRGAKKYSLAELVPGLQIEVKGTGDSSGSIAASEIRFTKDDFKVAQTMDTRVVPVENGLAQTQTRLGETEKNAQRMSGQVQELSAITNEARSGAKAAQETADSAMSSATDARSRADSARAGVRAANERITSLDEYSVKDTATIHFKVGSVSLSNEEKGELEKIAGQAKNEKGYLIEVAGFASSDGNVEYNRRLSQQRADAVIHYMAENHSIPMRRFITPMGYGESQPVADNHSRTGRQENRRVEVRILVNKGLMTVQNGSEEMSSTHRQ